MKLDTATLAIVVALAAFLSSMYSSTTNLKQAARISRLEQSMRAQCGAGSPNHHVDSCAELSLPLKIPQSPLGPLVDEDE